MPQLDLMDCAPTSGVWGNPWSLKMVSDHLPVSFCLTRHMAKAPDRKVIPHWLIQTAPFVVEFLALLNEHGPDLKVMSPIEAVETIKTH